jgi:hypothetical protein
MAVQMNFVQAERRPQSYDLVDEVRKVPARAVAGMIGTAVINLVVKDHGPFLRDPAEWGEIIAPDPTASVYEEERRFGPMANDVIPDAAARDADVSFPFLQRGRGLGANPHRPAEKRHQYQNSHDSLPLGVVG